MQADHLLRTMYVALVLTSCMPAFTHGASTPDWKPGKRVEIVVPSGPGGGNDRIVRIIQQTMRERKLSDAAITITNKPGAGQALGIAYINQQTPDGNHIGIASVSFMTNFITGRSAIGPNDIMPLALLFEEYVGFAVKPDSKIRSGGDLLAALKPILHRSALRCRGAARAITITSRSRPSPPQSAATSGS